MSEFDPYKHIRELARSIMRQERTVDSVPDNEASSAQKLAAERQDLQACAEPPCSPNAAPPSAHPNRPSRRAGTDLGPIAATLKSARLRKGLTQRELGRLAGVPQSHVSKIEAGAVDLRFSSLIALAELLDLRFELVPSSESTSSPAPALALVGGAPATEESAGEARGPVAAATRSGHAPRDPAAPANGVAQ